jgi:hypothetical protein
MSGMQEMVVFDVVDGGNGRRVVVEHREGGAGAPMRVSDAGMACCREAAEYLRVG